MNYQLDVSKGYQVSKKHFLLLSLLFSLIFTVVLISDVLLVVLSNDNYIVALIISIVITVLFAWFAIYFFYNIYADVNNEYRFYKGYESGLKEIGEVIYINQDTELTYINGLYAYPVHVAYINGLEKTDKVIYTIEKLDYRQGDKLSIITYRRILVKVELHP